MNLKKPGVLLILVMIVLCLSLDVFTSFGGYVAPGLVSHTMCALRPLGFFAKFLFANEWPQLVSEYCATFPREPAISIIAFMLKISVVAFSLVLTVTMVMFLLRETTEYLPEEVNASQIDRRGIAISDLAGLIKGLVIFLLPTILGWWLITSGSPREFHTSLFYKSFEDIVLLGVYIGGMLFCAAFCKFALLPALRWLFPGRDWIRL